MHACMRSLLWAAGSLSDALLAAVHRSAESAGFNLLAVISFSLLQICVAL